MDGLHIAFVLLLTTGCCCGQGAPPSALLNGAAGGNVTFTIRNLSTGNSLETFTWKFNASSGSAIVYNSTSNSSAPEYMGRISVDPLIGTLVLRELKLNDSGDYTVTLKENGTDEERTEETKLAVYVTITMANITGPSELLIAGRGPANLTCSADSGTMIFREWQVDGNPLPSGGRITFSDDNSTVSINPVQATDTGNYKCILTNPVSTASASYNLTVNFGPDNVNISSKASAEVNSRVELICTAESLPPATYSWMVNGTAKATKNNFIIEKVSIDDAGNYTCVASNKVTGRNSSAVHALTVTVKEPQPDPEPSQSLSGGAIAGIVIGTVAGAGLIGGGGFFAYKKWYR